MNRIVLYKDMTEWVKMPYRIAEVFPSIDGHRTRVTSHCFATETEANAAIADIKKRIQEEL